MTVFKIKKGIEGILDALFYSFTNKITPQRVYNEDIFQQELGAETIYITATEKEETRVFCALKKYAGEEIACDIKVCLLSCDKDAPLTAFNYAKLTLDCRKNMFNAMSYKAVSDFRFTLQKVLYERHRFCGFLRFSETEKGVLYAPYSPDNDITEILAPHFKKRLGVLPFIIHDLRREKLALFDGKNIYILKTDKKISANFSNSEQQIKDLFKTYFEKVNIKERQNKRLQDNFLPRRYRAFMPETYETD